MGSRIYQYQNITTMPTMYSHGRVIVSGAGIIRLIQKTYSNAPMDSSFPGPFQMRSRVKYFSFP